MMKNLLSQSATLTRFVPRGFVGHFEGGQQFTNILTRARVAYLIRAARSRRSGSVTRTPAKGYRLNDCRYVITRVSVAVLV